MKLCGGTRSCWQCQIWMLRRIGTYKIHSSHPAWQLRVVFSFHAHGCCPWQPHAGPSILARGDVPGNGGPPAVNGGSYSAAQMAGQEFFRSPGLAGATPAGAYSPYPPIPIPAAGARYPRRQHGQQVLWQAHPQAQGETGGSIPPLPSSLHHIQVEENIFPISVKHNLPLIAHEFIILLFLLGKTSCGFEISRFW